MITSDLLAEVSERGYKFAHPGASEDLLRTLYSEAGTLDLAIGDHVQNPISKGSKREVRQLHARSYKEVGDPTIPVASRLCRDLEGVAKSLPELSGWRLTEVGYQLYRGPTDFISPHRDRKTDQMFSITITIRGSAVVRILEPNDDPEDYSDLREFDRFTTQEGTVMFLRAPGLGSGAQVIHEVLPPGLEGRLILNLRSRPDVLPQPTKR